MDIKELQLYFKEENIIENALRICSEEKHSDNELLDDYSKLLTEYQKLLKQTRKLVRMSDNQQKELNLANERLKKLTSEKITAYEKLNEVYETLKEDLSFAQKIQENILPGDEINIPGLDFCVKFFPMIEVGGDIYDIAEIRPGYTRLFLADATGHGIQAALVTMIIKSEYEMLKKNILAPGKLLDFLNEIFMTTHQKLNVFFTNIVVDIDLNNNRLIYASAGHADQFLITGDKILKLEHTGRLMGFAGDLNIKEEEIEIEEGCKILLFSDGYYEQYNSSGEEYGEKRFFESIIQYKDMPLRESIDRSLSDLDDFMKNDEFKDDQTLIGVQVLAKENG
ncbi:MAG: serine/threonine-protein phosphatase [bacterium]|nr:serine/threonine-protein phosphatase [bacterium]